MGTTTRPFRRTVTLSVAGLLLLSLTGCFGVDGGFRGLGNTVAQQAGTSIRETEFEFRIGGFMLGIASKIIGMSQDEETLQVRDMLRQVRGVQIGVYRLDRFQPQLHNLRSISETLVEGLESEHYDSIIRSYDSGGLGLVLVKTQPERAHSISELVVVKAGSNEMVIIQLSGDVNAIVEIAARERQVPGVERISDS